jgi:16S rRNA (uracil1498-N3)-methyltransferase
VTTPRFHAPLAGTGLARVQLPAHEVHHLRDVLRLSRGAAVRVFDGRGREWAARVEQVDRHAAAVLLDAEIQPVAEPPAPVTLGLAILKADFMEEALRDAAMVGVSAIQPLIAARTVVGVRTADADRLTARWQRIVLASIKQCGRAVVPAVHGPESAGAWMAMQRDATQLKLLLSEPAMTAAAGAPAPIVWRRGRADGALLVSGPEGGWTASEFDTARAAGFIPWTISPRVLRADAAPAIALSLLFYEWERNLDS